MKLQLADVLFIEIIGCSALPTDEGASLHEILTRMVEDTKTFLSARQPAELIACPTVEGMALAFFDNPLAPVRCAIDISRRARAHGGLKLRMGLHQGLVERTIDGNKQPNVSGDGINRAQRVMSCGDAGHILLSEGFADNLRQLTDWQGNILDVGLIEVKHGERIRISNLAGRGFGNAAPPAKSLSRWLATAQEYAQTIRASVGILPQWRLSPMLHYDLEQMYEAYPGTSLVGQGALPYEVLADRRTLSKPGWLQLEWLDTQFRLPNELRTHRSEMIALFRKKKWATQQNRHCPRVSRFDQSKHRLVLQPARYTDQIATNLCLDHRLETPLGKCKTLRETDQFFRLASIEGHVELKPKTTQ